METFSELLLLLEDLLLVGKSIAQGDVLKSVLMNLLILGLISLLPLLDDLGAKLFASPGVDSIHSDTALQLFELLLNLCALGLLLIQLVLELASHAVVPVLSLFEIVTDLMNVGKGVEVLVLVEHLVSLLLVVTVVVVVHQDDFTLSLFIRLLQLLVLPSFVLDRLNELSLHSRLGW